MDSISTSRDALLDLFRQHGCERVDTPVLQPASVFLDLSGEDIRRRLLLTQDAEGTELCLRPEYTIPVCRQHLARRRAGGRYCYLGPVFRQRSEEGSEFDQAGVEWLGTAEEAAAADAAVFDIAVQGLRLFPGQDVEIVVGDMGLLEAVLVALELPASARRRLVRALSAGHAVDKAIASEGRAPVSDYAGLLAAIEGQDPRAAKAFVEDVISIAGIAPVGGRSAAEIAERFLSRAANRGGGMTREAREVLRRYLAIDASLEEAASAIRQLARETGLDLAVPLGALEERSRSFAARGLDLGGIRFWARFARSLDYYTGFIFEIRGGPAPAHRHLIGGGRYDRLLGQLGSSEPIAAVGCAFWLDRLEGMRL